MFVYTCQDLQLPPAFSLPSEEPIAAAIELAYDRDFSHIPRVPDLDRNDIITDTNYAERVLTKERRPLGYIDVAALKAKWEAGRADPVCSITFSSMSQLTLVMHLYYSE